MNSEFFTYLRPFLLILIILLSGCTTFADLLCRTCGHSVTTASALINVKSPAAEDSWNMTILGVNTFVQVFKNSVPEKFNLIFANGADLKFAGRAHTEETWFEGMSWRACVCSVCNTHIGWYFQSPNTDFVGLVIDNLISEEYVDTLTKVPFPHKQSKSIENAQSSTNIRDEL